MDLCTVQVHTESEALDPLELKPQVVVKHLAMSVLGTRPRASVRAAHTLNHQAISLDPTASFNPTYTS